MAYSMIAIYGMNEKVGNVSFYGMQQDQFNKPYSDETANMIDEEVRKLVDGQYKRAQDLLTEKRAELNALAHALLDKEVLLKSDVIKLIGPTPWHNKEHEVVDIKIDEDESTDIDVNPVEEPSEN
jgi:cell division protease FtsH